MSSSDLLSESASTNKIGIIIPPPALKRTIEVTAEHVSKNGIRFEKDLLSSNESKFNFLLENPYNKYYKSILDRKFSKLEDDLMEEDEEEEGDLIKSESTGDVNIGSISKSASVTFHMNRERSKPTSDPFEYFYDTPIPSSVKSLDLDIIKLTAQYTAMNGKQFLFEVSSRENKNPQFDFLKPTHRHFHFFNKMVDIYMKIIFPDRLTPMEVQKMHQQQNPTQPFDSDNTPIVKAKNEDHIFKYLNMFANPENKLKVLDMLFQKAEWEILQEEKQRREQLDRDDDKSVFDLIDWHDFIVVETIDFDEDVNEIEFDDGEEEEKTTESEQEPSYEETYEEPLEYEEEAPYLEEVELSHHVSDMPQQAEEEEEEELDPSRFARAYQRTKDTSKAAAPLMFKDKTTGELIPASMAEKHLKVSTINPQYFEQKERERSKREKTNIAPGLEMTKVIASWNDSDQEKQPTNQDQVIWDGYSSSIHRTTSAAMKNAPVGGSHKKDLQLVGPQDPAEYFKQEQENRQQIAQMAATMALKEMIKHSHQGTFEEPESKKRKQNEEDDE